jgi:hypothetical protein
MPVKFNPRTLALLGIGTGLGGMFGRHVTPRVFGYEGDEAATNLSTLVDASLGAGLGALAGNPAVAMRLLSRPSAIPAAVSGAALSETLPMAVHALGRGTEAAESVSRGRLLDQIREVAGSPAGRGAGIGAAGAGLAALTSGLLRPQSTAERAIDKSRGGMVASDFLKFIIPALIAGGMGGKMVGNADSR